MNEGVSADRGNIFVWGHFGKKLEKLDKDRFLAISQSNPEMHLSRIYNKRMSKIIDYIPDDMEKFFSEMENENNLDNLFRQVAHYMRYNISDVSMGSAMTTELEKSHNVGKIVKSRIDLNE